MSGYYPDSQQGPDMVNPRPRVKVTQGKSGETFIEVTTETSDGEWRTWRWQYVQTKGKKSTLVPLEEVCKQPESARPVEADTPNGFHPGNYVYGTTLWETAEKSPSGRYSGAYAALPNIDLPDNARTIGQRGWGLDEDEPPEGSNYTTSAHKSGANQSDYSYGGDFWSTPRTPSVLETDQRPVENGNKKSKNDKKKKRRH